MNIHRNRSRAVFIIASICGAMLPFGCSGDLEPGEGPGFSQFDPELTGSELYAALPSPAVGFIDGPPVPGESVTIDCFSGGSATFTFSENQNASVQYSQCGETMNLRTQEFEVVVNGSEIYSVQGSGDNIQLTGNTSQSIGGDIGMSAKCNTNISSGNLTINCVFRDNDGEEILYNPDFSDIDFGPS